MIVFDADSFTLPQLTGDYFGILMDARVTGFPFNVTDAPMYYGSTMSFLGTALWFAKPAGLLLTVLVFVVYKVALMFEEYAQFLIFPQLDECCTIGFG